MSDFSLGEHAARDAAEGSSAPQHGTEGSSMYKSISPSAIGVFARQSELLEIGLTHRFKGLEIDISEVLRRAQASSVAQACRYLCSAHVKIGGFDLPIRWSGDEKNFNSDLSLLGVLLEVCGALGADRCFTTIRPTCEQRPFHENFQFHVDRLGQLADALAPGNVKVGLNFFAAPSDRADGGFEFIHQVDPLLLLINSASKDNVGLVFDAWEWWVGGGDLEKLRTMRGEQVLSVRLSDIPAGTDLATITSDQRVMPSENGLIDSAAILTALDDMGFDGPVSLAPNPNLFKGQKREEIVGRASATLDALLGAVTSAKPLAAAGK
jgi:sugar phosphate isomerase/epimerase